MQHSSCIAISSLKTNSLKSALKLGGLGRGPMNDDGGDGDLTLEGPGCGDGDRGLNAPDGGDGDLTLEGPGCGDGDRGPNGPGCGDGCHTLEGSGCVDGDRGLDSPGGSDLTLDRPGCGDGDLVKIDLADDHRRVFSRHKSAKK